MNKTVNDNITTNEEILDIVVNADGSITIIIINSLEVIK